MPGAILGADDVTVSKMADIPALSGQFFSERKRVNKCIPMIDIGKWYTKMRPGKED